MECMIADAIEFNLHKVFISRRDFPISRTSAISEGGFTKERKRQGGRGHWGFPTTYWRSFCFKLSPILLNTI